MDTNSENPDEMQHNAAIQQGLHCLLNVNIKGSEVIIYR